MVVPGKGLPAGLERIHRFAQLLEGEIDAPPTVAVRGVPLDGKETPHGPSVNPERVRAVSAPLAGMAH